MVDESHVTTIATHPDYRGRGVGELLLSSLIDVSYEIGARVVTLEVRVSNSIAQNLYRKYGFREAGIRKRYYSDNHEDALIMWTPEIRTPEYREQFLRLKAVLATRLESNARVTGPQTLSTHGDGAGG
jgi:ribosomal-protein-alanine N-acetyltransferase